MAASEKIIAFRAEFGSVYYHGVAYTIPHAAAEIEATGRMPLRARGARDGGGVTNEF